MKLAVFAWIDSCDIFDQISPEDVCMLFLVAAAAAAVKSYNGFRPVLDD